MRKEYRLSDGRLIRDHSKYYYTGGSLSVKCLYVHSKEGKDAVPLEALAKVLELEKYTDHILCFKGLINRCRDIGLHISAWCDGCAEAYRIDPSLYQVEWNHQPTSEDPGNYEVTDEEGVVWHVTRPPECELREWFS